VSALPPTAARLPARASRRELLAAAGVGLGAGGLAVVAAAQPGRWPAALVLAALGLTALALALGEVRRPLLALVIADTAFLWDVNLLQRPDLAAVGSLPGLNVSLTTFGLAGLLVLWLLDAAARVPGTPPLRASLPAVVYVAVVALSLTVAVDPSASAYEVAIAVQSLLLLAYLASWVRTPADLRFVAASVLVTTLLAVAAMAALRQGLSLPGIEGVGDRVTAQGLDRLGGTFGSPNEAASYLVVVLPVALALALAPLGRPLRLLAALTGAAAATALVLTYSRGGWLGVAVALVLLLALGGRRGAIPLRRAVAVLAVAAAALLPFMPAIAARLLGDPDNAAGSRLPLLDLAWRMFADHPVLGVGANGFGAAIPAYATPDLDLTWLYTVHDRYLLVLAETGIVGLLAYLWFLGATLRRGLAATRSADPLVAAASIGLVAGLAGFLVHALVELFNSRAQIQVLFLAAGLLLACARMERSP
jgi:putative inorganic carbon (HCO3(-)) transporter